MLTLQRPMTQDLQVFEVTFGISDLLADNFSYIRSSHENGVALRKKGHKGRGFRYTRSRNYSVTNFFLTSILITSFIIAKEPKLVLPD